MEKRSPNTLRHRFNPSDRDTEPATKSVMRGPIGKTADGTRFQVPETHDMVTSLFNPFAPKSVFDLCTLWCMFCQVVLWLVLPRAIGRWVLLLCFVFWRLAYNVGLGLVLKHQSDAHGLVSAYQQRQVRKRPWIKRQLSLKMGNDYDFDTLPDEYNTWLLFRQLVDVVLMNDFVSYALFVLSWYNASVFSTSVYYMLGGLLRWSFGIFLIIFNVWVKLDAHRVVKDYAWYWGDFFFLIEQSLTFDGVFEMAPHPMYSIGYFGYYGLSLISASYMVLFVSIGAHALQFAFLILVETPHIDKVYNAKALPKHKPRVNMTLDDDIKLMMVALDKNAGRDMAPYYFRPDLIVFKNLDLCRSADLMSVVIMVYSVVVPLLVPGCAGQVVAFAQALAWRAIYSLGLGSLLKAQSDSMFYTRHFIKWGGTAADAFQHWKSIFNLALSMTYITFFVACCKFYSLPQDWTYGMTLLRHVLGLVFMALHVWTSVSIYDVLGDYGWFYGDFFIDQQRHTLLYTGIYRYLNNPEKIIGNSGFWGMTLMTNHWMIYVLALFSQLCNILFLQYVEEPHMHKLYGETIRQESGVTKTLRNAITMARDALPNLRSFHLVSSPVKSASTQIQKLETALGETVSSVTTAGEAGSNALKGMIHETRTSLAEKSQEPEPEYHVHVKSGDQSLALGHAISIDWSSSVPQQYRDSWVGVYRHNAAASYAAMAHGRTKGQWAWLMDTHHTAKKGTIVLKGTQIPWKPGTYECRLHSGKLHRTLATSAPFVIAASHPPKVDDSDTMQLFLLKMVQNLMANDVERMPMSEIDPFVLADNEAKLLATVVADTFNVTFAWQVLQMDTAVAKLTERIQQAHDVLGPKQRRFSAPINA
ncbi:phospholipid methyltransferase-domain-containing protein [Gongronella butleri]|nr:phospholipid methyltransferase-domain-containing protein [Gongronella butleri]